MIKPCGKPGKEKWRNKNLSFVDDKPYCKQGRDKKGLKAFLLLMRKPYLKPGINIRQAEE
jgi:hypothetical protein